jgi:hypothetical protein
MKGLQKKIMKRFKCRDKEMGSVSFADVKIITGTDGFRLHQQQYISTLNTLSDSSAFQKYRSLREILS